MVAREWLAATPRVLPEREIVVGWRASAVGWVRGERWGRMSASVSSLREREAREKCVVVSMAVVDERSVEVLTVGNVGCSVCRVG